MSLAGIRLERVEWLSGRRTCGTSGLTLSEDHEIRSRPRISGGGKSRLANVILAWYRAKCDLKL